MKKSGGQGKAAGGPRGALPARACWCGSEDFTPFGPAYARCEACGTLAVLGAPLERPVEVKDDEADFYGKRYWLEHQRETLASTDIFGRSRVDLSERNLHWLSILLKYRLPPATVLELGCGHGSFVALMGQAGFRASGVEMSPWVVEFGRKAFGISVLHGPIENVDVEAGSLDAMVLMDVLEHIPDPVATMSRCVRLLKPAGILLVQMPRVPEGASYEDLVARNDPFLQMLQPDEHLFLFSERSAGDLMRRVGAPHVVFEPAIFSHYDMCFVAGGTPFESNGTDGIESALLATPGGRMSLAMLDLRAREMARQSDVAKAVSDVRFLEERVRAGERDVERLRRNVEHDGNALQGESAGLRATLSAMDADREARGKVIDDQGRRVAQLEAAVDARLRELGSLHDEAEALRNARNLLQAQLADLRGNFEAVEADRLARGKVIEEQGREMAGLHAEVDLRLKELGALHVEAEALRNGNNLLQAQLADVRRNFEAAEADRLARGSVIEEQGRRMAGLEAAVSRTEQDRDRHEAQAARIAAELEARQRDLGLEIERLQSEVARQERAMTELEARWWIRVGRGLGLL